VNLELRYLTHAVDLGLDTDALKVPSDLSCLRFRSEVGHVSQGIFAQRLVETVEDKAEVSRCLVHTIRSAIGT